MQNCTDYIRLLNSFQERLGKELGNNYHLIISGNNEDNGYWIKVPFDERFTGSIDSVFYLTEIFVYNTLERRFELTIEDLVNPEQEELFSRIKKYFSN